MLRPDDAVRARTAGLAGAFALTCACALPLGAQVTQTPVTRPPVTQPRPELKMPQAPAGDLVITRASVITDPRNGNPIALLDMKNVGSVVVDVPKGTVIARGETPAGAISFAAVTVDAGYAIHPGTSFQVSLPTAGWCPAGKPGPVTFRVNPQNTLPESDRANNTYALPASAVGGDLRPTAVWLESQAFPPVGVTGRINPGQRNTLLIGAAADMYVDVENPGPGFVYICKGAVVLRDVQSPLAAVNGMRSYTDAFGHLLPPGGSAALKIPGAVPAVVVAPGSYVWKFLLNPDGTISESSAANNSVTTNVTVFRP